MNEKEILKYLVTYAGKCVVKKDFSDSSEKDFINKFPEYFSEEPAGKYKTQNLSKSGLRELDKLNKKYNYPYDYDTHICKDA